MSQLNPDCSKIPPVTTSKYETKGTYETVGGLKTYITGPSTATRGIVEVYDVFGYHPATLQGADRLAETMGAVILVPDFFKGDPIPASAFPPDTEEKKQIVQKFMGERLWGAEHGENLLKVHSEARAKFPSVRAWGAFGLCWGGKVVALCSGKDTPFKASGTAHPGKLANEDAQAINIPHVVLFAPGDGTPEQIKEYKEILEAKGSQNEVETYDTMFHGWMGARANLENEENEKEFERGYYQVANFFAKHL